MEGKMDYMDKMEEKENRYIVKLPLQSPSLQQPMFILKTSCKQ